jgi:hypothetical protein
MSKSNFKYVKHMEIIYTTMSKLFSKHTKYVQIVQLCQNQTPNTLNICKSHQRVKDQTAKKVKHIEII